MNATSKRRILRQGIVLLAVAGALAPTLAQADVVTEKTITLDGLAGFSLLAMSGTSTQSLTGDRMRTDSNIQFKSKLLNMIGGKGGNTSQIVRLDQGVVYDLHHADRKYTEMTFEQMRAQMQQAMQQMEEASRQQAAAQQQQLPVDTESCQMSEPVVEARSTGEHATIAGYDAERASISLKQSCTDPKTQKTCDMVWSIDNWLTQSSPGGEEARSFALAYANRLGLDAESIQAMQNRMQGAYSQYKSVWTEVMKKAAEFKGYPLKTTMQISIGGPQCTTESGNQIASDPSFAEAGGAAVGGSVGNAVGGSAVGALASKIGASLMGKFKKKDKPAEGAPAAAAAGGEAAASGMVNLFRLTTETTAIHEGAIAPATFEVPAGYKRVEAH